MVTDLFSSFDYSFGVNSFVMMNICWVLMTAMLVMVLNKVSFFYKSNRCSVILDYLSMNIYPEVSNCNLSRYGGGQCFMVAVLIIVMFFNVVGSAPYVFSVSSHFCFTLSLSLVIWLGVNLLSVSYKVKQFMSMFMCPGISVVGAMVLIFVEIFSNLVRSISLGLRLSLNMMGGQIFMGLLGGFCSNIMLNLFSAKGLVMMMLLGVLTCCEVVVCLIQAVLFIYLVNMYLEELS